MALLSQFAANKRIAVSTVGITTTALADFPICIHVSSASWPSATERAAFFGSHNVNGKRVQFYDAALNNLVYEVEKYDASNQVAVYWVKVPTLAANGTTTIWLGYGADPNGADQDNKTAVWSTDYRAVYHMDSSLADSTANALNLTAYGSANASGAVGDCRDYNGTTSYDSRSHSSLLNLGSAFTITMWVCLDVALSNQPRQYNGLLEKGNGGWQSRTYGFYFDRPNNTLIFNVVNTSGSAYYVQLLRANASSYFPAATWKHVTVTVNGGASASLLIDNAVVASTTTFNGSPLQNSLGLFVGRLGASVYECDCKIDELRLAATALSGDYVTMLYRSTRVANGYVAGDIVTYPSATANPFFYQRFVLGR